MVRLILSNCQKLNLTLIVSGDWQCRAVAQETKITQLKKAE